MRIRTLMLLLIPFFMTAFSYAQVPSLRADRITEKKRMITWRKELLIRQDIVIESEVTIMPQAYIRTAKGATITFKKRVTILGESQVFDPGANLIFDPGALSELNISWFGATGYDETDDTKAFQKAISIAEKIPTTTTLIIPVGRYFISETLSSGDGQPGRKAINWQGKGVSNDNVQGASLSWKGSPGGTMIVIQNASQFIIENLDFTAEAGSFLQYNIELRPMLHAGYLRHCSFSGTTGDQSANINLNDGDGDQVSEIHIENCIFNGIAPSRKNPSGSAIRGGLANTKNFYIQACSFDQYEKAAIDIHNSDILHVEGCTFSNNEIDISCLLCGTYAISNYSEHSRAFFNGSFSSNVAFTTLINNNFTGNPADGYVVRDGSGSLVLVNNNFGGTDQREDNNRIRWEEGLLNPIYSTGNFYKNASADHPPFYNRSHQPRVSHVTSVGDIGGRNALERKQIER